MVMPTTQQALRDYIQYAEKELKSLERRDKELRGNITIAYDKLIKMEVNNERYTKDTNGDKEGS